MKDEGWTVNAGGAAVRETGSYSSPFPPAFILSLLFFAEAIGDQGLKCLQRLGLVRAARLEEDA